MATTNINNYDLLLPWILLDIIVAFKPVQSITFYGIDKMYTKANH
jgi:hypothetical protein